MQRRASRLILSHEVDYKSRLEKLNLLPLHMRREIADVVFLFKIIHELVDIPGGFLSWKNTGRSLRNTDDITLTVPFARTDVLSTHISFVLHAYGTRFLTHYVLFSICRILRNNLLYIILNFFLLLLILDQI